MLELEEERFQLTIPLHEAVAFAMGWSNLGYTEPKEALRKIIALLAIDALEYSEQWRVAAQLRACLRNRWPDFGG
jgi:hypothetical protein